MFYCQHNYKLVGNTGNKLTGNMRVNHRVRYKLRVIQWVCIMYGLDINDKYTALKKITFCDRNREQNGD